MPWPTRVAVLWKRKNCFAAIIFHLEFTYRRNIFIVFLILWFAVAQIWPRRIDFSRYNVILMCTHFCYISLHPHRKSWTIRSFAARPQITYNEYSSFAAKIVTVLEHNEPQHHRLQLIRIEAICAAISLSNYTQIYILLKLFGAHGGADYIHCTYKI